ncbi:hypothetical protein [Campylobacter troglodytis]|uniref:hypothetical protein n=1 Tax=Campylobacter troglodytis TaxID=654363 RepID=UPI00163CD320|nr:hypothetical protein [Campylobacter troglodytis]
MSLKHLNLQVLNSKDLSSIFANFATVSVNSKPTANKISTQILSNNTSMMMHTLVC